jgi:peptidase E
MAGASQPPQIVAMGGASFDPAYGALPLLRYTLDLAGKKRPKVCLVPTASGENGELIIKFYAASVPLAYTPSHLSLFSPPTADLGGFILGQDVILVGGGNTKSMLALWHEWGLDDILRAAWQRGIVLSGWSAGSICWFEQGITDSIPGPLTPLPCLGYLAGSNCPHYDGEPERRPSYHRLLAEGRIGPGYAADDAVGLHYIGERLEHVVSARAGATAYRLELADDGAVRETPLEALALPAD